MMESLPHKTFEPPDVKTNFVQDLFVPVFSPKSSNKRNRTGNCDDVALIPTECGK